MRLHQGKKGKQRHKRRWWITVSYSRGTSGTAGKRSPAVAGNSALWVIHIYQDGSFLMINPRLINRNRGWKFSNHGVSLACFYHTVVKPQQMPFKESFCLWLAYTSCSIKRKFSSDLKQLIWRLNHMWTPAREWFRFAASVRVWWFCSTDSVRASHAPQTNAG